MLYLGVGPCHQNKNTNAEEDLRLGRCVGCGVSTADVEGRSYSIPVCKWGTELFRN